MEVTGISSQSEGRFDTFHALEGDKQQRIIRAAQAEFSEKGFKKASTNKIAAQAKIGKGMLFYYFGSKEELYDFICEYTLEFIGREFLGKFISDTGDFFERQRLLSMAKKQAMAKEPLIFALYESFYSQENAAYTAKFNDILVQYRKDFFHRLYDGLDESLFRPDLAPADAIKYISWLLEGYTVEVERRIASGDLKFNRIEEEEWERYGRFIHDLRTLFYK